jgi:hypothetical protein
MPTIFLDGYPVSGLMHWSSKPEQEDIVLFKNAGINFFSFMGNLSVSPPEKVSEEDLEVCAIDQIMRNNF